LPYGFIDHIIILTLSAKTYRIAEQTVSSSISCFHLCIVFMINTAHAKTKMFSIDVHE